MKRIALYTLILLVMALAYSCEKNPGGDEPDPATPEEAVEKYKNAYDIIFSESEDNIDYAAAIVLLKEASAIGCDSADFMLGICSEYSLGTEQSMQAARNWYEKAAKEGNQDAKEKLRMLDEANAQISLPEGSGIKMSDVFILNENELMDANGDGSFKANPGSIKLMNENGLVFFSWQPAISETKASAGEKFTLDAMETASSLLTMSIPLIGNATSEVIINKAKEEVRALPETHALAEAIDASIKARGYIEYEDIVQQESAGLEKISELIGLREIYEKASQSLSMSTKSGERKSIESTTGTVDYKPTIKRGAIYGKSPHHIITDLDEAVYDPSKKAWHATLSVYNQFPFYVFLAPGYIDHEKGMYSTIDDRYLLDHVCGPINATFNIEFYGFDGISSFLSAQKRFWTSLGEVIGSMVTGDLDDIIDTSARTSISSTRTTFEMDIRDEDDVIVVVPPGTDRTTLTYNITKLVVIPTISTIIGKAFDDEDLLLGIGLKVLADNSDELLLRIQNAIERKQFKYLQDAIWDFTVAVAEELLDADFDVLFEIGVKKGPQLFLSKRAFKRYSAAIVKKGALKTIENMKLVMHVLNYSLSVIEWIVTADMLEAYGIEFNLNDPNAPVDLGLSVLWASHNVGATSPESRGTLFAWGDITPMKPFEEEDFLEDVNYKWCVERPNCSWVDFPYMATKYCIKDYSGKFDGRMALLPEDDAATHYWKEMWRTPAYSEWMELINNCKWERTFYRGVPVYKVTSTVPGFEDKYIILPYTHNASIYEDYLDVSGNLCGTYWSRDLNISEEMYNEISAMTILFDADNARISAFPRNVPAPVRPVMGAIQECHAYGVGIRESTTTPFMSSYLSLKRVNVNVGNKTTMTAYVFPENASNKEVTWSVSNPSVAKVEKYYDKDGHSECVIVGLAKGTSLVYATTVDGGHRDVGSINVQ